MRMATLSFLLVRVRRNPERSVDCRPMKNKIPPSEVPSCDDARPGLADGAAEPRPMLKAIKRFGPLVVIAAVMLLVFAMGWHRKVTVENIVALRDHFHVVLAEHRVVSILAF